MHAFFPKQKLLALVIKFYSCEYYIHLMVLPKELDGSWRLADSRRREDDHY